MINVSETAASKINELLVEENKGGSGLRVFVQGGGCSGFQYGLMIEENGQGAGDQVFESHGVKLFVDPISIRYLKGAEVDFVDTVTGGGFTIKNPNATSTCGCGSILQRRVTEAREGAPPLRPLRACARRGRQTLDQTRTDSGDLPETGRSPERRRSLRSRPAPASRHRPRHGVPHAAVDGRSRASPARSTSAKGRSRFEPTYRHPRHFHLICTTCHRSSEFLSSDVEALMEEIAAGAQFSADAGRSCRSSAPARSAGRARRATPRPRRIDGATTELVFARDALRIAIATERSGLQFYTRAASITKDARGRSVFQKLADRREGAPRHAREALRGAPGQGSAARVAADVPVLQGRGQRPVRRGRRAARQGRQRSRGAAHRHQVRARLAQLLQEVRRALRRLRRQADLPRVRRRRARASRSADQRVPGAPRSGRAAGPASARARRRRREVAPLIDLHTHTTASDGRCTPAELVARAAAAGVAGAERHRPRHDGRVRAASPPRARRPASSSCPASRSRRSWTARTCTCSATSSIPTTARSACFSPSSGACAIDRVRQMIERLADARHSSRRRRDAAARADGRRRRPPAGRGSRARWSPAGTSPTPARRSIAGWRRAGRRSCERIGPAPEDVFARDSRARAASRRSRIRACSSATI